MPELLHPSVSAMGSHLDERVLEREGEGLRKSIERWLGSGREPNVPVARKAAPETDEDRRIEEAMHLGQ